MQSDHVDLMNRQILLPKRADVSVNAMTIALLALAQQSLLQSIDDVFRGVLQPSVV